MSSGGNNPYQPWDPDDDAYPPWDPDDYAGPPWDPEDEPYPPDPHAPTPYGPYPPGPPPPPEPRRSARRWLSDDEWPTLGDLIARRGITLWVLLVPCLWPLTMSFLIGYPLARSARHRARRVFPAHGHHPHDPEVLRVQKARAWAATVMSGLILFVYGTQEDVDQAQVQILLRIAVAPWLLLLSAPLVVWLLHRWASPESRRTMRTNLRAAGRRALLYFGAFTSLPLLGLATVYVQRTYAYRTGPWVTFAVLLPLLWMLFFVVFATGPAVRGAFHTSEVHAALPALLTGLLVWEFAAIGLVLGGLPPGPPLVRASAILGGPASVTVLAWWEVRRLRARHGVVLRA